MAKTFEMSASRRFGNRMMAAMTTRGFGPKGTYVLTVTGRKTGLPRSTPVAILHHGDERWLVSPYGVVDWVRNARAAGQVTLRRGGDVETVGVTEVGPEQAGPVLKRYVEKNGIVRPYFDSAPGASTEDFAAEAAGHPVFVIGDRVA
jgi:deazaflavin-dependent oxidoreductase (nitroreductase family)